MSPLETARLYAQSARLKASEPEVAALARAYLDLHEASQWQDISTAPKDGRWLLVQCAFADSVEIRILRYVGTDTREGPYGRFVWACQDNPGFACIAEKVAVAWKPAPQPEEKP